ncbi:hypothetical protein DPMN_184304 [Dreissena polymorpha]|uniref:Uncharacterized protein n=1 Tax=Dreissena polymorpha TaxID=45954 RepID=A0A9D4DJA0_DREPO|nr:hypothetical protein DPMN_184304 [Dreissena polymorpha]
MTTWIHVKSGYRTHAIFIGFLMEVLPGDLFRNKDPSQARNFDDQRVRMRQNHKTLGFVSSADDYRSQSSGCRSKDA